jgi:hypothetical protein
VKNEDVEIQIDTSAKKEETEVVAAEGEATVGLSEDDK